MPYPGQEPHLPHTGEQPAEEERAVALHEGGEEGKDAVDGERHQEALPAPKPVC